MIPYVVPVNIRLHHRASAVYSASNDRLNRGKTTVDTASIGHLHHTLYILPVLFSSTIRKLPYIVRVMIISVVGTLFYIVPVRTTYPVITLPYTVPVMSSSSAGTILPVLTTFTAGTLLFTVTAPLGSLPPSPHPPPQKTWRTVQNDIYFL